MSFSYHGLSIFWLSHFDFDILLHPFTQGLWKQCKYYEEWDDNYRQMMKLSDVPSSQPEGYLVRFPFYALAERDAHIVFSETENPDWFADDVYEFGKSKEIVFFFVCCCKNLVNGCALLNLCKYPCLKKKTHQVC